ncbi:MAG: hypothetical protein ACE5F1_21255 [Planctomycetota bacterium]
MGKLVTTIFGRATQCTHCGEKAAEVTRIGRASICPRCLALKESAEKTKHLSPEEEDELVPLPDGLTRNQWRSWMDTTTLLRTVFGSIASHLPFAAYIGLYLWGAEGGLGLTCFTGYLIADCVTWILRAAIDGRGHPVRITIQLLLYAVVVRFWYEASGILSLPKDPGDRGVAGLVFMFVFGVKMCGFIYERMQKGAPTSSGEYFDVHK